MWWRDGREGSALSGLWCGSHQLSDEALRAIMRGERERERERSLVNQYASKAVIFKHNNNYYYGTLMETHCLVTEHTLK